jgi:hypothetical protein
MKSVEWELGYMYTAVQNAGIERKDRIVIGDIVISEEGKIVEYPRGARRDKVSWARLPMCGASMCSGGLDGQSISAVWKHAIAGRFLHTAQGGVAEEHTVVILRERPGEDRFYASRNANRKRTQWWTTPSILLHQRL